MEYKQKFRDSQRNDDEEKGQSSNQFNYKATDSQGRNTERRVDSNLAKYYSEDGERSTPQLQDIGLGYKKKKMDPLNKYDYLASKTKNVKPDPKVLEDIQKIK